LHIVRILAKIATHSRHDCHFNPAMIATFQ